MLDYAANIVAFWPVDRVRTVFEQRCVTAGLEPISETVAFLRGSSADVAEDDAGAAVDEFWQRVGDNLIARRLRLIFVADVIPRELQAIIEFLNEGLATTDVLAVEVKQYVGEGRQTLVPRVIGWTTVAEDIKQGRTRTTRTSPWDEGSFFAALREEPGEWAVSIARTMLDWAVERGLDVGYGMGPKQATMSVALQNPAGKRRAIFTCVTAGGGVVLQFDGLKHLPPFDDPVARAEVRSRLSGIEGLNAERLPDSWPQVRWDLLRPEASLRVFVEAFDWVADRVRRSQES